MPNLEEGEQEHVVLFQDESTAHANDHQSNYWLTAGEQVLKKKDKGRLIMVSDFICEAIGPLALTEAAKRENEKRPEHEQLPEKARVIIYPSSKSGGDAYWNMEQMIAQVSDRHISP